jgi:hypothetical protein
MKILIATMLGVLMTSMFSAHAEDVTQPPEPYVLTLTPQFLELWKNFATLDACKAEGTELVNSADIFNGFACEQGRAWIGVNEVAVPAVWMPPQQDWNGEGS